MRNGDRLRRRLGLPMVGLVLALAVAACGGASRRSSTTSIASASRPAAPTSARKLPFVVRVDRLCSQMSTAISDIPYPVYAAGQTRYEVRETAVERSGLRRLASTHAPAPVASAYREFERLLNEAVSDGVQARLMAARHRPTEQQRLQVDAAGASRRASIDAGEMGMWGCAAGYPPLQFLARTAAERVIANLDHACAQAAEVDENDGIDEAVIAAQVRAGRLTQKAARTQLGIDFINAGDFSRYAAKSLAHVRVQAGSQSTLHDLGFQLEQSGALFLNAGVALEHDQPIDLSSLAVVIGQAAKRAGLDGRALKSPYCTAL